ncbi:serine kinase [uncultured Ruegeria sp.]|jgi:HPr kinase/phosphorylase|uniref:HPr kinase/phosphorylase n=1 Tax=uncultured Ruegeria sp. TaxID=259304 RepID=UPI00262E7E59|nr:serine kinase [uncultured Ruegeria sp.]
MKTSSLSDAMNQDSARVHASCVAVAGRGLLIVGVPGTGKSALTLQMMAFGAEFIADDRVDLRLERGKVTAITVQNISGLVEARGIGLLHASSAGSATVHYVVDLDQTEDARLPEPITIQLLGQTVPLLRGAGVPNLPAALIQLLKMGRVDPEWPSK